MCTVLFCFLYHVNCSVFEMEKNKSCTACSIDLDKDKYGKDRTICKDCFIRKKRKKNKLSGKDERISIRTLLVGLIF